MKAKKIILNILIVICALVFLGSAGYLGKYYWDARQQEKAFDALRGTPESGDGIAPMDQDDYAKRQAQLLKLKKQNGDLVGWLMVPGTRIDYPVMQTPDNQNEYLRRDFDHNYSTGGTLFASDICDIDKPSDLIIIYGHMMRSGTMFGELKNYKEKSFWQDHRYVRFDTLQESREYEIFCVLRTAVDTGRANEFKYYDVADFGNEEDFNSFIAQAKTLEYYDTGVKPEYGGPMIALSTCEYSQTNGRMVVLARQLNAPGEAVTETAEP